MGKSIVEIVMDLLRDSQIRVDRAYPGGVMPAAETMVAAVALKQLDQAASTATVEVSVMTPAHLGAGECEDKGVWICRMLKSIGGSCCQGKAEHIVGANLFRVSIDAVFYGQETINGWEDIPSAPTFAVRIGDVPLNYVESFAVHRAIEETMDSISDAVWYFRIEELFPLDAQEEEIPEEPYTITVSRVGQTETLSGCVINTHKRTLEDSGLRQIREGEATSRMVTET